MPPGLKKEVEMAIKKGKYASKSEFFRHLLRLWKEEQLMRDIEESKKDFAEGRWKVLKSLKDLR